MVSENLVNYLGQRHSYAGINCITIISAFYENELKIKVFKDLFEKIKKDNKDISTRRWMKQITLENIDSWAATCAKKVSLTNAQNYDVIVFRSLRGENPIHFGLYIDSMRMFHLEEGAHSMITSIDKYWSQRLYAVYRYVV
jgi:hypothetical protein|tara:strand:+ start:3138 stop:3560 length:423 start_codon:yes stop_codon:yes gene_type:complete